MDRKTMGFLSALALSASLVGCGHREVDWANEGVGKRKPPSIALMPSAAPVAPVAVTTPAKTEPAKPRPEAKATAKHADAQLSVRRLVVATSVDRSTREPIGAAERFERGSFDRLYAFVEVENGERRPAEIFVTFEPEQGTSRGQVSLDVGGTPRWRTWAYTKAADKPGNWVAVVRNDRGEVLARTPFTIAG